MILVIIATAVLIVTTILICYYERKSNKSICCYLCNYFRNKRIDKQVNRIRRREIRKSRTTQRLNVAEEMELQAIHEEEVISPYAIGEAEENAHYLEPKETVQYSNVVPKTKTWQVGAGNQMVEVPQYLNTAGFQVSPEGDNEPKEEIPTPKTRTIVF